MTHEISLIERLEARNSNGFVELPSYRNPDGPEAVALIRELVAGIHEIERICRSPDELDGVTILEIITTLRAKASQ